STAAAVMGSGRAKRCAPACRRAAVRRRLAKPATGGAAPPGKSGVRSAASCDRATRTAPVAAASAAAGPGGPRRVPGQTRQLRPGLAGIAPVAAVGAAGRRSAESAVSAVPGADGAGVVALGQNPGGEQPAQEAEEVRLPRDTHLLGQHTPDERAV